MPILQDVFGRLAAGEKLSRETLLDLARGNHSDLFDTAEAVTRAMASRVFNLCAIVNSKSGRCSENCRWCAQSRLWQTKAECYPFVPYERILEGALRAQKAGITRFSLVNSGRKPSAREIREICDAARRLTRDTRLEVCVSLGLLRPDELAALKSAGVVRIHCNLEASARFFPKVCTSHRTEDKIETLRAARAAGLEVCSGGIIGMGERMEDRLDLALELRELEVPSIPINVLVPIPGTPLENAAPLSADEVLVTVALFRLATPKAALRLAGGRLRLSAPTIREALRIGINAAISGDMLTTAGAAPEKDLEMLLGAGYEAERLP